MKQVFNDKLEEDYRTLPEWAGHLRKLAPDFYHNYVELRGSILNDGVLKRKEKDLILVGVNAAKRYNPSLIGHTRLAIYNGATPKEVAEAVLVGIISRGIPTWMEGRKAVLEAEILCNEKVSLEDELKATSDQDSEQPDWLLELKTLSPTIGENYLLLRKSILQDGNLSRLFKELILVGINLSDGYHEGTKLHVGNSRLLGATDQHLIEVALTVVLTSGIPAWFNILPFIERKPILM